MLRFWELAPSPNNIKVRLALRFKGIEFETVPVDPFDRSPVIEVSGQELTPVVEDRGIVLNDSEAILQYLDANYPDRPRLIPGERAGRSAADAWKERIDRELAAAWYPIFLHALKQREAPTDDELNAYRDALRRLDDELGDRDAFAPAAPIHDLRVAEWTVYGLPGEGLLARVRLFRRFRDLYAVDPASVPSLVRFLQPWNDRLA